jgi:hypothetical protein
MDRSASVRASPNPHGRATREADMSAADTRALVEMEPGERPVRIAPPLPDLESTAPYWHGPAGAEGLLWRARALAAEALVAELRRQLARYRFRP